MKNKEKIISQFEVLSVCAIIGLYSSIAIAQDVEEVVVQAEKSENALVNDLASAAVLDGEKLADAGIENVEDVAAYVPNLVLAETSTGTNIVIRGIGAGVNQGFDQSVGLYVDKVPLPRSQMARAPFLDLAGVQVLRGPQYVNDGNYSIAGSVHMLTRAASDEFELDLDFVHIPSQNEKKLLLTLGTPITDRLGLRLAVERKTADGYIKNVARNEDGPQADNLLIRSVFNFAASEDLTVKLKYEEGRFETRGRQIEIIESQATPDYRTFYNGTAIPAEFLGDPAAARGPVSLQNRNDKQLESAYSQEIDFTYVDTEYAIGYEQPANLVGAPNSEPRDPAFAGRSYLQVLHDIYTGDVQDNPDGSPAQTTQLGIPFINPLTGPGTPPPGLLDSTVNFERAANEDERSKSVSRNLTLNVDYRIGDHTLEFVASNITYDYDDFIDTDFTAVPILFTDQSEDYEQQFYRFDYKSPAENFLQINAGFSYLESELQFDERIGDHFGGPQTQLEAAEFLFNTSNTADVAAFTEIRRELLQFDERFPARPYFGRTNLLAAQALQFFDFDRQFRQEAETTAAFAEVTLNFSERLRAIIGGRYTLGKKRAVRDFALVLNNGEPFTAVDELDNFPFASANARTEAINRLVVQIGGIFNIQPHSDRIPQLLFYPFGGVTNGVASNTEGDCSLQWSFALGGPCDPDPANGPRRDEQFLPSAKLQFDVTPDLSMYVGVAMANKLGGFDARSVSTPGGAPNFGIDPGTFGFEDEDATTYELGANWFLPDGWGELRAAAFYTKFKDLQVSAADRSIGQNVRNAASATTLGIEIEGLLQFSEAFNVNYSLAWIEFEFGDYPIAACALGSRADGILITDGSPLPIYGNTGDVVNIYYEDADAIQSLTGLDEGYSVGWNQAPSLAASTFTIYELPDGTRGTADGAIPVGATAIETFGGQSAYSVSLLGPKVCQFEGRTNQYVADVQGTFSFNYRKEIPRFNLMLKPTLDVLYNSGYETTVRQDPDVAQGEYTQFNGRLAIASLEDSWEVAVVGQNLTNEKIVGFASEVPIGTRFQGSKTHFGFIRPPRSYGLNFRYKFY